MSISKIYLILVMCFFYMPEIIATGWTRIDFKSANSFGDTIPYLYIADDPTALTVSQMQDNSSWYKTDSLVIPETVNHGDQDYIVKKISTWCFINGPEHVKKLHLPKTYIGLDYTTSWLIGEFNIVSPFFDSPFEEIIVAEDNPYYKSEEGILYSKDGSILITYPKNKKNYESLIIGEHVIELENGAFCCNPYIKTLTLPNTLKKIQGGSFADLKSLEELVLKDSVIDIETLAFVGHVPRLILGKGVKKVSTDFIYNPDQQVTLICYANIPPTIYVSSITSANPNVITYHDSIHLFVPRAALTAYQRAAGWKDCASILPIEPPIVVGKDEAEVSWVQNFSATGYVWTLYTDEAKTKRFMSLTFDANGHLTRIDINSNSAPERMMPLDDEEEEKRFAEYYSFTITGLSPQTQYFYTRQSLKGTEVIDEETGSFTTDSPSNLHDINANGLTNKILHEGHLLINHNGHLHTATGARVK